MNLLLPFVVSLLMPVSSAAEFEVREALKCGRSPVLGAVIAVDDVVVWDAAIPGTAPESGRAMLPPTEAIFSIEVRCLKVRSSEDESHWVTRDAAVVVTRAGARPLAEQHLADLVDAQGLHHEQTGSFAPTLAALQFTEGRASLGIRLTTSEDGWSASVAPEGLGFECRVAVGAPADLDQALRSGVPVCTSTELVPQNWTRR